MKNDPMNCGECLMERVERVQLIDYKCPKCGTDYAPYMKAVGADLEPHDDGVTDDELSEIEAREDRQRYEAQAKDGAP